MPPFYVAIIILVVIVVSIVYGIYSSISSTLNYYKSLGARVVGYRFLSPVATLGEMLLYTDYKRGGNSLIVELPIKASGYIKLRKRDFLDKLLFQKSYKGLSVEYDDELWANKLFSLKEFVETVDRLFEEYGVDWIELKDNKLRVGWRIGKASPDIIDPEILLEVVEIIKGFKDISKAIPLSQVHREGLRGWLTFKIPIALTIVLSIIGIAGGFYHYKPTCPLNMLLTGYKLLLPFVVLYTGIALVLVGGPTMGQRVILKTLFVSFMCSFFITIFFFTYINGRLDSSKPELKRDWVVRKYIGVARGNSGPRLRLANYHSKNPWCESFKVSREFYESVSMGSLVEYQTKKGLLGVEWFYTGLYLVK